MLALSAGTRVYLACKPVSMRKGFDGLAALTRSLFDADPFSGHRNRPIVTACPGCRWCCNPRRY